METKINKFWYRWLLAVTVGTALFGLAFVILPHQVQSLYAYLLYGTTDARALFAENYQFVTFLYGVLGAVLFGWAISLEITLMTTFRKGYREGWLAFTASVVLWYVVDSALSVYWGFSMNAVFNTVFLVLFAIPLAATYRDFYGTNPAPQQILARE